MQDTQTKHRMAMLNRAGHALLEYDVENEQELVGARALFNEQRRSGHAAFRQPAVGNPELIHEFDPNAETILFAPPLVGG